MKVSLDASPPERSEADLICVGITEEDGLPPWLEGAPGAADVEAGFEKLTLLRPGGPERVLVAGLGPAGELGCRALAWALPRADAALATAAVSGTILAAYDFDRLKSEPDEESEAEAPTELRLHGAGEIVGIEAEVEAARVASLAANDARDLQSLPANVADPDFLGARAEEIAAGSDAIEAELIDVRQIAELGMGGLISVAEGSAKDPLLIVLRYRGNPGGETLGIVGKAVTFDTGGISLKPSASMHEMKMDMSGGAAALEATAAIAALGLPLNVLTVVPAVENMPGGRATRPGDVITQLNGKTVEVNNTDAEGRLILADALTWCERQGADRIVDLATLTGAVIAALGSTHAAVIANDDELAALVERAGKAAGELTWRLPRHPEYRALMDGTVADLSNAAPKRKAGTISAAEFLAEFVEEVPWAHIDIAGTSWDVDRAYVGKGPTGFGVRLLLELARALSAAAGPE